MADNDNELNQVDEVIKTPPPGDESDSEHERIRRSNDLDQQMERQGIRSPHNQGYDETVDGIRPTRLD